MAVAPASSARTPPAAILACAPVWQADWLRFVSGTFGLPLPSSPKVSMRSRGIGRHPEPERQVIANKALAAS